LRLLMGIPELVINLLEFFTVDEFFWCHRMWEP
jgi:hypothetical protein